MSIKISKIDQNYNAIDINTLAKSLEEADREYMTTEDLEKEAFAKLGTIPARVAVAKANEFGLRKAFFDVWKPAESSAPGIWKLTKEADGTEWIIKEENSDNIKHS